MSAIQQFQQSFTMRHSVFKNSAAPICGFSFLLSSGFLFWLQWFPFLFAAHQSFLFAAFDFCLQRPLFFCSVSLVRNRIYGLVLCANICVLAYVCMQRTHEKKWTPHWKKPTEQKRLQVYVAKKTARVLCHNFKTYGRPYNKISYKNGCYAHIACPQSKSTGDWAKILFPDVSDVIFIVILSWQK